MDRGEKKKDGERQEELEEEGRDNKGKIKGGKTVI